MATAKAHNLAMADDLLPYYAAPGVFTSVGPFAQQLDALPDDIGKLAHAVQMLLVHRFWAQAYQVEVLPERDKEQGLHGAEAMLAQAMRLSPAPIGAVRLPPQRVVGICRHFATMLCAFLRHKGIPARARCGFAAYFEPGKYVDHWICEYRNRAEARWIQVDAQLDALQVSVVKPDFDPLDVPRDRFLVAGNVWQQVRAGAIDALRCGIAGMWGDWYVRGNLALDMAALQKVELLPWEPFGIAKSPQSTLPDTDELLALVDRAAALTARGDATSIAELLVLADADVRFRPPQATIDAAKAADAAGPTAGNPIVVN